MTALHSLERLCKAHNYDCVSTMMEEGTQEDLVALKLKHTHTHFLLSYSFCKKGKKNSITKTFACAGDSLLVHDVVPAHVETHKSTECRTAAR